MTNEYRPLFNRKYLIGLVWFSLIAIMILSSMGPGAVKYHDIESNEARTLSWMELDDQPITLVLLLPTRPAFNSTQRQLQQLQSQILQQRLNALANPTYSYHVLPRQDRIEVTLRWSSTQELPDLKSIWSALSQPVESARWQDQLKTIQARQYLDGQNSEQQIINHFYERLQPSNRMTVLGNLSRSFNIMFQNPRFALSGEGAEDLVSAIEDSLPQQQSDQNAALISASPQFIQHGESTDQRFRLLVGTLIPARDSKDFVQERLSAQVLQDLLSQQQTQYNLNFRMLWAALSDTGYRALIIDGVQNPGPVLPQLSQMITEDLVEKSQQNLASQWHDNMRDIANQVQALNLIAFYRLPEDTLETYAEQVLDQDTDQVIELARKALQADKQISILQSPSL
ncbi:hypothetical protein [Neptuniibacter sp. QD48_11]|uniref:hypothetical protein n=1 Tax=unclassified Neptuniibacter TaxID=2630693 RepID=UPI0039F585D1